MRAIVGRVIWIVVGHVDGVRSKSGVRAERFLPLEARNLMLNLCLVSTSLGLVTIPLGGFLEGEICAEMQLWKGDRGYPAVLTEPGPDPRAVSLDRIGPARPQWPHVDWSPVGIGGWHGVADGTNLLGLQAGYPGMVSDVPQPGSVPLRLVAQVSYPVSNSLQAKPSACT